MQSYQWLSSVLEQRIENRDTYTHTNTNTNKTWVWSVNIFCAVKIYSWFILKDNDFYFSANWFGWFFVVWHCCVHFMSCRKTCHKNGGTSCQLILLGRHSEKVKGSIWFVCCDFAIWPLIMLEMFLLQVSFNISPHCEAKTSSIRFAQRLCFRFRFLSSSSGGRGAHWAKVANFGSSRHPWYFRASVGI